MKPSRYGIHAIFAWLLLASSPAQSAHSQAVLAYDQGDFTQAVAIWEQELTTNPNGHVYYNLGNSYFRLGERGQAMAAFLAAKRLRPRDPDIRTNLKHVHASIGDDLAYEHQSGLAALLFWRTSLSVNELLMSFCSLWCLGFLLLALQRFVRTASLKRAGWICLSLATLLGLACSLSLWDQSSHGWGRWGAITAPETSVRSGPSEHTEVLFTLQAGAPVAPHHTLAASIPAGWQAIKLADGKKGWVRQEAVRIH